MGRRKAKASRIRAIHYKYGDDEEIFYLDRNGRHLNREIEKLDKVKRAPFSVKCNINKNDNKTLNDEIKIPEITNTVPTINPQNIVLNSNISKKLSSKFYEAYSKFPAASLMWINNPEYSGNII